MNSSAGGGGANNYVVTVSEKQNEVIAISTDPANIITLSAQSGLTTMSDATDYSMLSKVNSTIKSQNS